MRLVEQADLLQHAFSVDGRAAAGGEDLRWLPISGGRLPLPPGVGPAQHAVPVACVVNALGGVPHEHPGADRESLWPRLKGITEGFDEARTGFRVVVEKDDIGSPRRLDAHIYGMAEAGVGGKRDEGHLRERVFYQLPASVRGAVVHYDYVVLRGRHVLGQKGFQAFLYEFDAIVVGDDDSGFGHGFLLVDSSAGAGRIFSSI